MSDYHVLEASDNGRRLKVVMHISVPTQSNLANKTLSACLVEDVDKVKTSVLASISTIEANALVAGTLVEHVISFRTNRGIPNSTKRTRLDAEYSLTVMHVQNVLRRRYWGWGFERNVV